MKVWAAVFNLITVLVLIVMAVCYVNMTRVFERDFDQARFDYAVEQATEAMFRDTLNAEDIGLDYTDLAYVTLDSSSAIDVFRHVMCFNYNMSPSDENFDAIDQSIAACCLAGYNGYYILQAVESDSILDGRPRDSIGYRFGVKRPYLFTDNTNIDTASKMYALDLYKNTYTSITYNSSNGANGGTVSRPKVVQEAGEFPLIDITAEQAKVLAAQEIRAAVINEIDHSESVSNRTLSELSLYLPIETTKTGVNPVAIPGIFMICSNASYAATDDISSMSVSGFKVINKRYVIGFVDNRTGLAYYCYESQLTDAEKANVKIVDYYDTVQEACLAECKDTGTHYAPYFELLKRKIGN